MQPKDGYKPVKCTVNKTFGGNKNEYTRNHNKGRTHQDIANYD